VRTSLKNKYGLSEQDYAKMFDEQDGQCAICGLFMVSQLDETRPDFKRAGFAPNEFARVDHDHATGEVRGLLCFSCNVGLGKFRDDERLLLAAVRYLRDTATSQNASRSSDVKARGEDEPLQRGTSIEPEADERRQVH
jgi:hypothetical protein